ncbi:MAG: DUF3703 domain-containing protein [Acidobacteria bacterium]|nr:DUF3703 domain-containing protein [Acidobacteriota bacterium]
MPLEKYIDTELTLADSLIASGDYHSAYYHLERAHILGQAITYQHTRIHWRMLKLGLKTRSVREIWGQIVRIIGASTKTPLGIYPAGNTGKANVWFFKSMKVPSDLQRILDESER